LADTQALTPKLVNSLSPPDRGEKWIADTAVPGFGVRLWATPSGGGKAFSIRATDADGKVVRKVFRPPSWWSFDENPRQLGEYLKSARYWARNEINRLRGLPTFEEIEERKRRQIAARRGKHTLFENLP